MPSLSLRGVIVPILTPMTNEGILWLDAFEPLVEFLIASKVAGLFPCGTTGEGPLLTRKERCQVAETVVKLARGRVPVIIHTGAVTTEKALYLTRHAQNIGADAVAIIPPYFYHLSDEVLIKFYGQIATAVPDFPIYLYNYPAVSNNDISLNVLERLSAEYPNIMGIKDSSGNLEMLKAIKALRGKRFSTAIGTDRLIATCVLQGADACVSGNSNVVPELVVDLFNASAAGDVATAQALQQTLDAFRIILKDGQDLSLFKALLAERGIQVGSVRSPLIRASSEQIAECVQEVMRLDPVLLAQFSPSVC